MPRTSNQIFRLLSLLLAMGLCFAQLQAQSLSSSIRGKVIDQHRAPIAGAQVTVVTEKKSTTTTALTDQSGEFAFPLEPGNYTVTISADGFGEYSETVSVKDSNA